jgi:hypothetical protein
MMRRIRKNLGWLIGWLNAVKMTRAIPWHLIVQKQWRKKEPEQ